MADDTPGEIVVKDRAAIRAAYTRDYSLRVPAADVGPGTQPDVDAQTFADGVMFLVNDAQVIGRGTNVRTSGGQWLKDIGEPEGIFARPAVGGSGALTISASVGGGTIQVGSEYREKNSGLRFRTISPTALYLDGSEIEVTGIDTGPATNFKAGTVLVLQAPPPGISQYGTVVLQNDGSGISGGREADGDEQYRSLIEARRANPPASGNDAAYQRAIEKTPGVPVEKAFTYPAALGSGTTAFCFTVRPSSVGGSRIPNAAQIAAVHDYVVGQFPADDQIFACLLTAQPINLSLRLTWAPGAIAWSDVTPWPLYIAGDPVVVDGAATPTPTAFRLTTGTSTANPTVGQTIGFYDAGAGRFQNKRIAFVSTVAAGLSWDITVDTSNAATDVGYTPSVGQAPSPYSGSLDALVPAIFGYTDGLGPGEQFATLPDPGKRQRRQPPSPNLWPSIVNNRIVVKPLALTAVESVSLLEPTDPFASTVGTPGVQSFLITVGNVAAFV